MKKSLLSLAAIALVSSAAFAGEADPSGQFALQIAGQRTRAEVNAEAVSAVAAGKLRPSNPHASASVQPALNSTTTRAQVVAEFLANRDEAVAMTGEDSGAAYIAKLGTPSAYHEYVAGTPTNAQ
jgi:hypothetical protein